MNVYHEIAYELVISIAEYLLFLGVGLNVFCWLMRDGKDLPVSRHLYQLYQQQIQPFVTGLFGTCEPLAAVIMESTKRKRRWYLTFDGMGCIARIAGNSAVLLLTDVTHVHNFATSIVGFMRVTIKMLSDPSIDDRLRQMHETLDAGLAPREWFTSDEAYRKYLFNRKRIPDAGEHHDN